MRKKNAIQRQQALEKAQNANRSPLSDKTNLVVAKSDIHDLKKTVNQLDKQLSETQIALTKSTELLKSSRERSNHHLNWYHNARKAVNRSRKVISDLRDKNRACVSVIEGLRKDMDEFKNKLTEKEREMSSCRLQANSYLQAVASANIRALGYWNALQEKEDKCLMLLKRITALTNRISRMRESIRDMQRTNRNRRTRLSRADKCLQKLRRIAAAVRNLLQLRQNGTYAPWVRSLVFRIALLGCPARQVGEIINGFIHTACNRIGITPKKKIRRISPRTVGRIISEADIAGKVQLAYEMKRTPSFTVGGDGTTNKNQTFESVHANYKTKKTYLNEDGSPCTSEEQVQRVRFIKLERAGNHRAETQKNETIACLREAADLFNRSPLASTNNLPGRPFNEQALAMKFVGTHGDHAEDQKAKHRLLGEWKHELTMRGLSAHYLCSRSEEERETLIASARASHISQMGGFEAWEMLSDEDRIQKDAEIFDRLCESLSDEAYEQLSEAEKRRLDLWVWAGCAMHKDLNAVKGGDSAMRAKWKEIKDSPGPVLLANKDNDAVLEAEDHDDDGEYEDLQDSATHVLPSFEYGEQSTSNGANVLGKMGCNQDSTKRGNKRKESAAQKRAREVSKAGGKKLMDLMGDMLKNKNDKKGHQHTFRDYAIFLLGFIISFPDTSNTRYSSYLEAAAETIARLDFYINYMHYIRDSKEKRTLNHLEANVLKGLLDVPTRTELAVLALYLEAVSHSYISLVRGHGLENTNALDLGPLHEKVRTHVKKLIEEPHIILSPSADPKQATMNGYDSWKNEEAVKAVHRMAPELPHLETLFKAFLSGALETWERFSEEFRADGTIASLTETERDFAWTPATNDANEGALGAYRVFARKNPAGSLRLFNSIYRAKRNKTHEFMESTLTDALDSVFLRREARAQEAMGTEKKRRHEIYEEGLENVAKKRRKDTEKQEKGEKRRYELDQVEQVVDETAINNMTVSQLRNQLDKIRPEAGCIPADYKLNKAQRRDHLLAALRSMGKLRAAGDVQTEPIEARPCEQASSCTIDEQ
ncbi:hypothetical protein ACEPAI_7329 [Sanghuangporus weigelae]